MPMTDEPRCRPSLERRALGVRTYLPDCPSAYPKLKFVIPSDVKGLS